MKKFLSVSMLLLFSFPISADELEPMADFRIHTIVSSGPRAFEGKKLAFGAAFFTFAKKGRQVHKLFLPITPFSCNDVSLNVYVRVDVDGFYAIPSTDYWLLTTGMIVPPEGRIVTSARGIFFRTISIAS
jgi:hypothetical protein